MSFLFTISSLMVRWIVGSIPYGGPIELFLITASAPQLDKQGPWYVLFCLWDAAYQSSSWSDFLSRYQNGSLPYVQRHTTVNKMCWVRRYIVQSHLNGYLILVVLTFWFKDFFKDVIKKKKYLSLKLIILINSLCIDIFLKENPNIFHFSTVESKRLHNVVELQTFSQVELVWPSLF